MITLGLGLLFNELVTIALVNSPGPDIADATASAICSPVSRVKLHVAVLDI